MLDGTISSLARCQLWWFANEMINLDFYYAILKDFSKKGKIPVSDTKGKHLLPEGKRLLISVKQYFDSNKSEFGSSESAAQMTADALGLGLATVNRVLGQYHKNPDIINELPQIRGHRAYSIDITNQEVVRAYIRKANIDGSHITLESIQSLLKEKSPDYSCHLSTHARTLDRWGFEFGRGIRTQHLKEKDYIIVARQRYLRNIRSNRDKHDKTIRPEVYLDDIGVRDFFVYFSIC